jgi:hypothetical protein
VTVRDPDGPSAAERPADPRPDPPSGAGKPGDERAGERDWERRRRLARIFGDVLPETTRDDRDEADVAERGSDAWLRAQVPPHHGS